MTLLNPPDSHHWQAAQGWLELDAPEEASCELDLIHPSFANLPEILSLRWEIASALKDWNTALEIGENLVQRHPDFLPGWIQRSFAFHEKGLTEEAYFSLRPAWDKFPDCDLIPYNLACYECCLGKCTEAVRWIRYAIQLAGKDCIRERSMEDPDLVNIIAEILRLTETANKKPSDQLD